VPSLRLGTALLCACVLVAPASASAATGGAAPPSPRTPAQPSGPSGGTTTEKKATGRSSLDVASLSLNGSNFYEYGRSIRATFQVDGRAGAVADLKLVVVQGAKRVKVVPIGRRAAGARQDVTLPTDGLPSGALELRLAGRDSRGRAIRSSAGSKAFTVHSHRFPVVGFHTFGGEGSKFGADRDGGKRRHQGQDVSAAEGTPMVAARGGVVRYTGDQPSGAGVYVVITGAGEGRDYVYMHLVQGSLLVRKGQTVRTGQLIGQVGQTGVGSGPHLHFEIWQGVWQGGGTPIDPLPLLRRWDAWS
jgi:murein DD-endopeptidase MepM/ murein hydrolase activator NlpD